MAEKNFEKKKKKPQKNASYLFLPHILKGLCSFGHLNNLKKENLMLTEELTLSQLVIHLIKFLGSFKSLYFLVKGKIFIIKINLEEDRNAHNM